MARKSRSQAKAPREETWDDPEMDEVDAFHDNQQKILLDQANQGRVQYEEMEPSDEEVLALSQSESSDEEGDEDAEEYDMDDAEMYGTEQKAPNDEDQGWGRSRANYYGADEAEDEEDAKLEEEEALRLQQKHLNALSKEDYYEDDDLEGWKQSVKETEDALVTQAYEQLPDQDFSQLDESARIALLKSAYPELIPLSQELTSLSKQLPEYEANRHHSKANQVKFTALNCYLGTISAYFGLFISRVSEGDRTSFKDHPIMEGILKAKEVWRVAQELDDTPQEISDDESAKQAVNESDEFASAAEDFDNANISSDEDELPVKERTKRKASDSQSESEQDSEDEFDITVPASRKTKPAKKKKRTVADYGDADVLDEIEQEEKDTRKKSIRFYTSKIAQKDNQMREMLEGDADVPYKERLYERQKRLLEEARQRGLRSENGDDEADKFSDTSDVSDNEHDSDDIGDGEADIYMKSKQASKQKKEDRRKTHELAVKAAKEGKLAELEDAITDENGKRAINYQILKNKGLTPKRNKDNRNARVKKRKKYDKAQKKLKSVRQVYKAPESAYGGESTGIKKNVTRSVRFA